MTQSHTDDERRIIPMGPELENAAAILSRQLIELHVVWRQYRQLYSDAGTIEVLNRTAGLFFKIVQDELWDSVLLGICRMLDPAEQGWGAKRRKNLTLRSLPELITDSALKDEVTAACDRASVAAAFAIEHRNKRIAHQDHGYATNHTVLELNGISRQQVEDMLKALRDVMQLIDTHYNDADVRYDAITVTGADRLVARLRRLERLTKAAIESSQPEG